MRLLLFACLFLLFSCHADTNQPTSSTLPIHLNWHLIENGVNEKNKQRQLAVFTIKNTGATPLAHNWMIYFNQNNEPFMDRVQDNGLQIEHINGNFFRLSPTEGYTTIAPGESLTLKYEGNNWSTKVSDAPEGVYAISSDAEGKAGTPEYVANYTITPFTKPAQINRNASDSFPIPTPSYRYTQNQLLQKLPKEQLLPIVPRPIKSIVLAGNVTLRNDFSLCYPAALKNERDYLLTTLEAVNLSIKDYVDGNCDKQSIQLLLSDGPIAGKNKEAYQLIIQPKSSTIIIRGTDPAGVFYGIQSLRSLIPATAYEDNRTPITLAGIQIDDAPQFPYRGMHLDVSRNFQSKTSVKKLLEAMATYKLNKLHFHLSDDEGWRLEIPGLPELTTIGAKRGHTLTEDTHLIPAYGSGPFVDNPESSGSGYFSKAEYIELLKYAKARHIEVIPEIDLPGHARAAIKAMEVRYKRLLKEGKTTAAEKYLLSDPSDLSTYRSVQGYKDNTTCVCQESLYTFLEKVVLEIYAMHEEADWPLQVLHTGGDEVPNGVWEQSPICEELLANRADIENTKEGLTGYFLKRFHDILAKQNLVTGGWEEIALTKDHSGEIAKHVPNPAFVNSKFQAYVWNSVFGWGGEDMAYQLANAGYPVVLCNASNLYFDLSYDKDPEISGLYWAGYVDTKKAFEFTPYNLFQTATMDKMGAALNRDELSKGMIQLSANAKKNILGMQGHLWSETFVNATKLERAAFPKLLGLAERAWAAPPTWASSPSIVETNKLLNQDWNVFANTLGQREMERMNYIAGGIDYHIPPPGYIIREGKVYSNTAYPGLEIRYTTDGSEPTAQSTLYSNAIPIVEGIRLKVFCGKQSSRSLLVQ